MVSEFRVVRRPARQRPEGPLRRQEQLRLQAPARVRPGALHLQQRPREVRRPLQLRAPHQRRPRVRRKQAGHTRQRLQVLADPSAKRELRQAEGRVAQPIPDRALKQSDLSQKDLSNLKATPVQASRVPTPNARALINPAQRNRRREHITARKQASTNRVVRRSNPNNKTKQFEILNDQPGSTQAAGLFRFWPI